MTHVPCVRNEQIASALSLADSTFRCFRLASAPALPFTRQPSPTGRNIVRAYSVIDMGGMVVGVGSLGMVLVWMVVGWVNVAEPPPRQ